MIADGEEGLTLVSELFLEYSDWGVITYPRDRGLIMYRGSINPAPPQQFHKTSVQLTCSYMYNTIIALPNHTAYVHVHLSIYNCIPYRGRGCEIQILRMSLKMNQIFKWPAIRPLCFPIVDSCLYFPPLPPRQI